MVFRTNKSIRLTYHILIFTLFVYTKTQAQAYQPLLDFKNEWQITDCFAGCNKSVYYTDGDTLISGKNYKILDGFHYISRTFFLREETDTRKVFLLKIDPDKSSEFLLYDFSISVGDSIELTNPYSPFPIDAGYFIVDSINLKVLVNGNTYRHFYLSPTSNNSISSASVVWIEGVGGQSLINAPGGEADYSGAGRLSCFFKNNDLFYAETDSSGICVQEYVLGLNPDPKIDFLKIYPNPVFGNTINLECNENIIEVMVLDLKGNLLYKSEINAMNSVIEFDLTTGIYFLNIETDRRSYRRKIEVLK